MYPGRLVQESMMSTGKSILECAALRPWQDSPQVSYTLKI